jgi:hypothetical protein
LVESLAHATTRSCIPQVYVAKLDFLLLKLDLFTELELQIQKICVASPSLSIGKNFMTLQLLQLVIGRVWFDFFLTSLSEKLAVGKSWLLGKAGG